MKNLTFFIFNYAKTKQLNSLSKESENVRNLRLFRTKKVANVYIFGFSISLNLLRFQVLGNVFKKYYNFFRFENIIFRNSNIHIRS